jgi:hypothetical protein
MQSPQSLLATPEESDRAINVPVAAFIVDPFIRWLFPDAKQYLTHFPQVLKYFAGAAFEHGGAYRSDDFKAGALWLPPYVEPDENSMTEVMAQGVESELQADAFAVLEQVGASHPTMPHWHLPRLSVSHR